MTKPKVNFFEDDLRDEATVVASKEGEHLKLNNIDVSFKITSEMSKDQLGLYEITLPPKSIGAKLHYHRFMDETFIVNQGIITIQLAKNEHQAMPGTVVYIPRFTPHGFRNDTNTFAKLTLIFNPAQKREGFFKGLKETLAENPIDPNKYLKLYNKYDSFPVDITNMIPVEEKNK